MFELNNEYNGFKCVEKKDIKDIKSVGFVFEHIKTGARLVYLKNDDTNKVFSIGFRTPVDDSTGVPHIIEHSVLCGSKKYPVKEPFVELLKSSVYTFLNAMTMPDHTLYPIASTNEKDFKNLMRVYLDAVFYPNIYNKKEIFMQEGWHYELLDKKDELTYKGVVYNEMKGVYSDPESVLFYKSMSSLYPDITYFNEYGGLPKDIPNLSYEDFIKFHKDHYNASNSYIFLYGNLDVNDAMKIINEEYLNDFERTSIEETKVKLQESFKKEVSLQDVYPIGEDEDISQKTLMSLNFSLANSMNMELGFAFKMLEYYLLETSASPLKKKILEKGLCNEMYGFYEDDLIQPFLGINFIEIEKSNAEVIKNKVFEVLENIATNGIDKDLMEAVINRVEFSYRKIVEESPRGLGYNFNMFKTWLYDGDALEPLFFEKHIDVIRDKFKNGYFENIIREYLIKNMHRSIVVLEPDKKIGVQRDNELKEKLAKIKESMTDEELEQIIADTKRLIELQAKPDDKKSLDTIPTLKLEDMNKEPNLIKIEQEKVDDTKVMLYECDNNKIACFDVTFDTRVVDEEDIPYINLLANVLTELSTEKYSYEELSKKINSITGDITFNTELLADYRDVDKYSPSLTLHVEGLEIKLRDMLELSSEIILNTVFNEESKIKEVISRLRIMMEQTFIQNGHLTVSKRIQSYYSQSGKYYDKISGLDFYRFVTELDANFDARKDDVIAKLKKVKDTVFKRENMYITLVGEKGVFNTYKEDIRNFKNMLSPLDENAKFNDYHFELKALNEGIMTQSDVQYVGEGYNFVKLGYKYSGKMQVLKQILSLDYLWNTVRVKGGAYGSKLAVGVRGEFIYASYRDPNLEETLNAYDNASKFLEDFVSDEDFYKYVVGTIGTFDRPLSPYTKAKIAEKRILNGIDDEEIRRERKEVFETTPEDIKELAKVVSAVTNEKNICVLGNESKIKANSNLFDNLITLKE